MKIHRSRHLPSRVPRWRVLKLRSSSLIPFHFAISLGFSYSYSALAVLVLVLEDTATSTSTSTSTISLSTSTVRNQECATSKLTRRVMKIRAKQDCQQFWPPIAQLQNTDARVHGFAETRLMFGYPLGGIAWNRLPVAPCRETETAFRQRMPLGRCIKTATWQPRAVRSIACRRIAGWFGRCVPS
jgi:hypothetical protein